MKKILTLAVLAAGAAFVQAQSVGFQLSLTPDVALHSRDITVRGLSLGIWSENPQHGLTLGIVNGSTGESSGFSWAWGVNYAGSYTGVQWAFVNISQTSFVGWQGGAVNYSQGTFEGLQSGFVNIAQDASGVQLGALNYTEKLNGVQIGFLNIVRDNGWFDQFPDKLATAFPIVNWSF
jgi:hypothetical protein